MYINKVKNVKEFYFSKKKFFLSNLFEVNSDVNFYIAWKRVSVILNIYNENLIRKLYKN